MAALVLISGPNGSGKSRYAEELIAHTIGKRYYIATMLPCTKENYRRIARHRAQRKELHFQTLELPYQVGAAPVAENSVVLLEDISNLLSNAIFEAGCTVDSVLQDILNLLSHCRLLVAVTISDLCEQNYSGETAAYISSLNELNRHLLESATVAITMQNNVPIYLKGDPHALI